MNSLLSSSYSRIVGSQREAPWYQRNQEIDNKGFYRDIGGLERASTRLADKAAGREMLAIRQKGQEEAMLEEQKGRIERRRLKLMARLGMK